MDGESGTSTNILDRQKDGQVGPETAGGKTDKTEAVLCWAHHEKAGFLGKDNNAGTNGRQQEKRKTDYELN